MLPFPFRRTHILVLAIALSVIGANAQERKSPNSDAQSALQRGQQALQAGDLGTAKAEFKKAVQLAPTDAAAQSALGWVLAQQGESESAVVHLRAALKAKPDFVDAQLTLASVLVHQGKVAEGTEQARAAAKGAPGNAEAHRTLARILSSTDPDESLREMQRAVDLAPQRADLRDDLGTLMAQRNQFEDAEKQYSEAIRLRPDSVHNSLLVYERGPAYVSNRLLI